MKLRKQPSHNTGFGKHDKKLINALGEAIPKGDAVYAGPLAVDPNNYSTKEEAGLAQKTIEAHIATQWFHAQQEHGFDEPCAIEWHPDNGTPQIFALPDDPSLFSEKEHALQFLAATIHDRWSPHEERQLPNVLKRISEDKGLGSETVNQRIKHLNSLITQLVGSYLEVIALVGLVTGKTPEEAFKCFMRFTPGALNPLVLGLPSEDELTKIFEQLRAAFFDTEIEEG